MSLPNINITFSTLAETVSMRGNKGTVLLILRDSTPGEYTVYSGADMPETLSQDSRDAVSRALIGGENTPDKSLVKIIGSSADISDALEWAALQEFDYLAGPLNISADEVETVTEWIESERAAGRKSKAVLPNAAADHEGVVNFSASKIKVGEKTYTAAQYCSRIAGLIAGTPFTQAATFALLPEVTDCTRMTRTEADTAIGEGKLIIWYDGRGFKLGRAVNSLVTTSSGHGEAFKKIKIVEIMDLIQQDIKRTAEDQFIGRYPNSYDSRCLLISAIRGYFEELAADGILASDFTVEIDIDANRKWMKEHNVDYSGMTEEQIRRFNTGSAVYLKAVVQILDVIEDIILPIQLNQ